MELIIGGAYQGKSRYIRETYPDYTIYDETTVAELERAGAEEKPVLNHFHLCVKQMLEETADSAKESKTPPEERIAAWAKNLIERYPDLIIASDEIGSGIVPIEKQERLWREVTGRVLCDLAKEAERVVRLTCGISMKLK